MSALSLVHQNGHVSVSSPEADYISSLIDSGSYTPESDGLDDSAFESHLVLHEWCALHQQRTGKAPPVALVRDKFPAFGYTAGLDRKWTAPELVLEVENRELRTTLSAQAKALAEKDHDSVRELMRESISRIPAGSTVGRSSSDLSYLDVEQEPGVPTLPGLLSIKTVGMLPGTVTLIGARTGHGKTWQLCRHAVVAAAAGYDVVFITQEMSFREVNDRLHRMALSSSAHDWDTMNVHERRARWDQWREGKGTITVHDESENIDSASRIVRTLAGRDPSKLLVIYDYLGLMRPSGTRGYSALWERQKEASRQLKQVAAVHRVPVLTAGQLNRVAGEKASRKNTDTDATGSLSGFSDTDSYGFDASVVYTMERKSETTAVFRIAKNRQGPTGGTWAERYDIANNTFGEIGMGQLKVYMDSEGPYPD